ncbi:hypothetical protein GPALN_011175 [Globodera pallida]|nr:hypothetical protein GPALN_011175 [Globodera pallida]
MEYTRLVFMSPIGEEDNPSFNFGDLSVSDGVAEKSLTTMGLNENEATNSQQQRRVLMDPRIEPTLLEELEKTGDSYSEQPSQFFQQLNEKQPFVGHQETKLHSFELLQQLDEKQQLVGHMEKKLHAYEAERGENNRQKAELLQLDEKQQLVAHMEKKLHAHEAERGENDRQKAELIRQLDEKHQFATQLERKLLAMESEIDSFDQVEESMLTANFKLQKELLKLKVRFGLISVDNAFKELGCCDKEVMEEIKTACQ